MKGVLFTTQAQGPRNIFFWFTREVEELWVGSTVQEYLRPWLVFFPCHAMHTCSKSSTPRYTVLEFPFSLLPAQEVCRLETLSAVQIAPLSVWRRPTQRCRD